MIYKRPTKKLEGLEVGDVIVYKRNTPVLNNDIPIELTTKVISICGRTYINIGSKTYVSTPDGYILDSDIIRIEKKST